MSESPTTPDPAGPVVSVITPAFNAAAYLPETVGSVLAQTFSNLELILIDDGSTDDTLAVARHLAARDSRVRVLATSNGGPAVARNVGIRAARGEFIALLDSDDLFRPEYLARQLAVFDEHPDVSIVTANAINRGGGPSHDGKPFWAETNGLERITARQIIERENAISIQSVFRRRVYDTIGGFSAAFTGNEDYEFWLRAALAGFVIIRNHETIGVYRRHDGSLSSDEPRMIRGILKVLRHVDVLLDDLPQERNALRRQIERFTRELPRAELRASLQRSDAAAAARILRLFGERGGGMVAACARLASRWPQPLLWAYRLRRAVRMA
jgi:glycosyltransferase involved in cell wall biosynthesis